MILDFLKRRAAKGPAQSVILNPQVPVRFDEPLRSWLGGLPQMPEATPWPRTEEGAPMHFLAQIACADLPPRIWEGRGPREGWLLAFTDLHSLLDGTGDEGPVRLLHIPALGPEREPPEDMGCVRHAMGDYIGDDAPIQRPGVPKLWRRWPVDLLVQEVPPPDDEGNWVPAHITAADLYDGPAADSAITRHGAFEGLDLRPLTWRGALYLVQGLQERMADQRSIYVQTDAPGPAPGWLAARIDKEKASLATHHANIARFTAQMNDPSNAPTEEKRTLWERHIAKEREAVTKYQKNLDDLAYYVGPDAEEVLAAEMRASGTAYLDWRAAQGAVLDGLLHLVMSQDLDAPLSDADWMALRARLAAPGPAHWHKWEAWQLKVRRSLMDHAGKWAEFALREDVLDLYTRSKAARAAIPTDILARAETFFRHVPNDDALNRMGGPRDPVQSYARPEEGDLVFQFGSDARLGWMWGDVGALYVYMSADDLKARRFARAEATLEGH